MRTIPVLLFFFLALAGASAQPADTDAGHYRIHGRVVDTDSNGIAFATISIPGMALERSTDKNGHFDFTIPQSAIQQYAAYGGLDKTIKVTTKNNLLMYDPPNGTIRLPYKPAMQARFTIRMAPKGSPVLLQDEKLLMSWLEQRVAVETQALKYAAAKRDVLAEAAQRFGLEKADVEQAFKQYKERLRNSADLYKRGLAALDDANEAGQASVRAAKLDAAERLFDEVIKKDEAAIAAGREAEQELPDVLYAMGMTFFNKALYDSARVHFSKAAAYRSEDSQVLGMLGRTLFELASYKRALEYYREAFTLDTLKFGTGHPETATRLNNIAMVHHMQGEYEQALEFYYKALSIDTIVFGNNHPEVATRLNNIGLVYKEQGQYNQALEFYYKALSIDTTVFGNSHPEVAKRLNNIAAVYHAQGQYNQALEFYYKALLIYKTTFGTGHPNVAACLNNIAGVYDKQGQYSKALEFYNKALLTFSDHFGPNHPQVATCLNNIAGVYDEQGQYSQALVYYNQAFIIDSTFLGSNHPRVATRLNNIATVYSTQGLYEPALELYDQALNINKEYFGESHPSVAICLNNIAMVFHTQGLYEQALELYDQALNINKEHFGESHPGVAACLSNIAGVYTSQSRFREALGYYDRTLEIYIAYKGPDHPDTQTIRENRDYAQFLSLPEHQRRAIKTQRYQALYHDATQPKSATDSLQLLNAIAVGYTKQQKADSALFYLEPAAALAQRLNHLKMTGTILNNKGAAHKQLHNWATAEKLLQQSIAFNRKEFGDTSAVLAYSYFHLAGVYFATGKAPAAGRDLLTKARALAVKHELEALLKDIVRLEEQWREE